MGLISRVSSRTYRHFVVKFFHRCEMASSLQQKVTPVNPKPFLEKLVGRMVTVKLKWGEEYRGLLESKDEYMNFRLQRCEEWGREINDDTNKREMKMKGMLGDVLIRCNNVLYIRQADNMGEAANEEGEMAE